MLDCHGNPAALLLLSCLPASVAGWNSSGEHFPQLPSAPQGCNPPQFPQPRVQLTLPLGFVTVILHWALPCARLMALEQPWDGFKAALTTTSTLFFAPCSAQLPPVSGGGSRLGAKGLLCLSRGGISTMRLVKAEQIYFSSPKKKNGSQVFSPPFAHGERALFSLLDPLNSDGFCLPARQCLSLLTTGRESNCSHPSSLALMGIEIKGIKGGEPWSLKGWGTARR